VSSGDTGHAETVEVQFDADRVSYRHLLEVLFAKIDPTTLNQQGPDVGTQYRSVVFAADAEQRRTAEQFLRELSKQPRFAGRSIVTAVETAKPFWPAEEYHQDYHEKHGGTCE
jgi:peptide-methionine (S)-S-oxide reductase